MQRSGLAVVLIGSMFLAGWASRTGDAGGRIARAAAAIPAPPLDLGLVPMYRAGAAPAAPSGWDASPPMAPADRAPAF